MGKFISIATKELFDTLWGNNHVDNYSLYFIEDTGQLYAHGVTLNSVVFGTEASGSVPVTIAGVTKTLALSNHTHTNYILNNTDIDISTYKIKSGNNNLIYTTSNPDTILIGSNNLSMYINANSALNTVRNNSTYTILDTGNFSVVNKTITNIELSNVATFKYGTSNFLLDYIKRINTSSSFDNLHNYTLAGTTLVNAKQYGYITLFTDGAILNPSWAQIRVNIPDLSVEFRTSSSTDWIGLNAGSVPTNALDVAGIVAAPTSATVNKVWKTDSQGNPAWRDDDTSNSWRDVYINDENDARLGTGTNTGGLRITSGTGISIGWTDSKLVITNSEPNIWRAATTSLSGYVPLLSLATIETIATQASEYVLTYNNANSETSPRWRKLPVNAFLNTTYKLKLNNATNGDSSNGTDLGTIYAPTSNGTGFLKGIASDGGAITWSWDNSTYVPINDYELKSFTKTISFSGDWVDTGIHGNDLGTGTYAVQVYMYYWELAMYACYWSGIMSWYEDNTNQENRESEILLHNASHYTGNDIYLRTYWTPDSGGGLKLQLACDTSFSDREVKFKFRKLI